MPCLQSASWVFTLNFSGDPPDIKSLFSLSADKIQFATWQHEKVTHDHLQGVIQFKKKSTTLRQALLVFTMYHPHMEPMRAKIEEAAAYANKEESRVAGPWTYGEMVKRGSNKRAMIEEYKKDPEGMAFENPAKSRRIRAFIDNEVFTVPVLNFDRPWQVELKALIDVPADNRKIIWVYGPDGGEGKSSYARYLLTKGWFYSRGGKAENIKYAYISNPVRDIVFDYPRSQNDYVNYAVIEELKDRIIDSTKYEPCQMAEVNNVHVIVMSNFLPEEGKFSADRVHKIYCNPL